MLNAREIKINNEYNNDIKLLLRLYICLNIDLNKSKGKGNK